MPEFPVFSNQELAHFAAGFRTGHLRHFESFTKQPERAWVTIQSLQDEVKQLRQKVAGCENADFWTNWVYPEGAKPQDIHNELADYRKFMKNAAEVFCHVTGGRISKVNTLASEIISEADQRTQQEVEVCVDDNLDCVLKGIEDLASNCPPNGEVAEVLKVLRADVEKMKGSKS